MAIWLVSALALLAPLGLRLARGAAGLAGRRGALPLAAGAGGLAAGEFIDLPFLGPGGGGDAPRRRRRKRALTASDRADIGFITGLLGTTAGKQFALTIASRS